MSHWQQLFFTTTSIRNTVISTRNDSIYYEVLTPGWEPHLTRIRRWDAATREYSLVGEILNENERPAFVHMSHGELLPADDFLPKEEGHPASAGTFRSLNGNIYRWQVKGDHLELNRNDLPDEFSLATYHKQRRYMRMLRMSQQPYLEVHGSALATLDVLIVSFLIAERRRRRFLRKNFP